MTQNDQSLVLRFRDLVRPTPGYTIEEHNKISAVHGYTWWGWWKKQSEDVPLELWGKLQRRTQQEPVHVFLLDSGQKKLYQANLLGLHFVPGSELCEAPEQGAKTP